MLYNKEFSDTLFKNPPAEYGGVPFWAWNTKLDDNLIKEQMEQFPKMGMGGFFAHVRVGLDTEYLGKEFLEQIRLCAEEAEKKGLHLWLYDEDRWPSGYGGGFVTKNPEYRGKFLVVTPFEDYRTRKRQKWFGANGCGNITGTGEFLASYYVKLSQDGYLEEYENCSENAPQKAGYQKWNLYMETSSDSPWFNNQAYVDTLNPKAIEEFIDVTHEKYREIVGKHFGSEIPGIFTDEPQFVHKQTFPVAEALKELVLPYTRDFEKEYKEKTGIDLLKEFPQILWELPGHEISQVRYYYHKLIMERFARSCTDQIGKWCEENSLALTGHMMEEPTLFSQSHALGEVMRNLQNFTIPGVDMLCDQREYTTVKQAQSVAHQCGREGVMCEAYGVTNWDFDFRHHKLQGDFLAALGVTLRVHHLTWMSMAGESKRDFPASIGLQSPWYEKYALVEDHFSRVNLALTQGKPYVKIGIIHSVESYWLYMGPNQQTSLIRDGLEKKFQDVTEWLLFSTLDFDYISEAMIPEIGAGSQIGYMDYDVILVPSCVTLRGSTLEFLKEKKRRGGEIVFMGEVPSHLDAVKSKKIERFAEECRRIPFEYGRLMEILEPYRVIDLTYAQELHKKKPLHFRNWDGERTKEYLYQMREDEDCFWLFLAKGKKEENMDMTCARRLKLEIKGRFEAVLYDTLCGEKKELSVFWQDGRTFLYLEAYLQDSFLIRLFPVSGKSGAEEKGKEEKKTELKQETEEIPIWNYPVKIDREEKNVAVLDLAEYQLDGGERQSREEVLRLDNRLRKELGWPLRREAFAQPWVQKENEEETRELSLFYEMEIRGEVPEMEIAAENLTSMRVRVNGEIQDICFNGYFVDHAIEKGYISGFQKGKNRIAISFPYSKKSNVEAVYLLGDFEVKIIGTNLFLCKEEKNRGYGSITDYGMPFYGGNVSYIQTIPLEKGEYELEVSLYRGALLELFLDGESQGEIIYAPYRRKLRVEEGGIHRLEMKCYGNRENTFGAFHNCDFSEIYFSPDAWRTEGAGWSYEYQLKEFGILKAPVLRLLK